jgi:hypothetical protein
MACNLFGEEDGANNRKLNTHSIIASCMRRQFGINSGLPQFEGVNVKYLMAFLLSFCLGRHLPMPTVCPFRFNARKRGQYT